MGKLGICDDEYDWTNNDRWSERDSDRGNGVETAFASMYQTPMQMAKFGQLMNVCDLARMDRCVIYKA